MDIRAEWWGKLFEDMAAELLWRKKLLILCDNHKLVGAAFVEPPKAHNIGTLKHIVGLLVDGAPLPAPPRLYCSNLKSKASLPTHFSLSLKVLPGRWWQLNLLAPS